MMTLRSSRSLWTVFNKQSNEPTDENDHLAETHEPLLSPENSNQIPFMETDPTPSINDNGCVPEESQIYQFNPEFSKNEEKDNHRYFPAHRNPYYIKLSNSELDRLCRRTTNDTRYGYLSLQFLQDLADDRIPWEALKEEKYVPSDELTQTESNILGQTLLELDFPRLEEDYAAEKKQLVDRLFPANDRSPDNGEFPANEDKRFKIPMRDNSGIRHYYVIEPSQMIVPGNTNNRYTYPPAKIKRVFSDIWYDRTAALYEGTAVWRRPRYERIELGFELVVICNSGKLEALGFADEHAFSSGVDEAIQQINDSFNSAQTKLRREKASFPLDGYIEVSQNPFELYCTYIKKADFDRYMNSLADGSQAIKGRHGEVYPHVAHLPINAVRQLPTEEHLIELKSRSKNASPQIQDSPRLEQELSIRKQTQNDYQTLINVVVSAKKMGRAAGKRTSTNAPTKVMGMSASECARDDLKWECHPSPTTGLNQLKLTNKLYMAEWLHLSAFSWGGLAALPENGRDEIFETSNIPSNLVLGTSETNSQMTRFEKAWQALVRDEALLGNDKFEPRLVIVRNPLTETGVAVTIDQRNEKMEYSQCSKLISLEGGDKYLLARAGEMKFLAYAVSYSMKFTESRSIILEGQGLDLKTTFYPFRRPFYHALEAHLDTYLYNLMKDRAQEVYNAEKSQIGSDYNLSHRSLFGSQDDTRRSLFQDGKNDYSGLKNDSVIRVSLQNPGDSIQNRDLEHSVLGKGGDPQKRITPVKPGKIRKYKEVRSGGHSGRKDLTRSGNGWIRGKNQRVKHPH